MRLKDWKPIAKKWPEGKGVALQTDSARAYKHKIRGVAHVSVVHQKKKIGDVWVNPTYAEQTVVTLPGGKKLDVVKGTQLIDGWWRALRKEFSAANKSGPESVAKVVRVAQWKRWRMNKDLWAEAGKAATRYLDRLHE